MSEDWRAQRDADAAEGTVKARDLLVGRTIVDAAITPHMDECDGVNVLRLALSDGTNVSVTGSYGGYTGHSCDEYIEFVSITREDA